MDAVSNVLSELLRWGTPLAGMAISFLAWRRFRTPGISLAIAGFAALLAGPVARVLIIENRRDNFSSGSDIALGLYVVSVFGSLGGVLLIVSLHRVISAAGKTATSADQTLSSGSV